MGIDARKYDEMRVGEQLFESNMIVVRCDNAGLISLIKKLKFRELYYFGVK